MFRAQRQDGQLVPATTWPITSGPRWTCRRIVVSALVLSGDSVLMDKFRALRVRLDLSVAHKKERGCELRDPKKQKAREH